MRPIRNILLDAISNRGHPKNLHGTRTTSVYLYKIQLYKVTELILFRY